MSKASRVLALLGILLSVFFLTSCGKVTQVYREGEDVKTFDLTYTVPITSSANIRLFTESHPNLPGNHLFGVEDKEVFVRVVGISADGKFDELSWGKAFLTERHILEDSGTVPRTDLQTVSYRKDGIRLKASDFGWSLLAVNEPDTDWIGTSKKIKYGYPTYLVMFYASKDKFLFSIFNDPDPTRKDSKKTIGDITPYDNFVSILYLQELRRSSSAVEDMSLLGDISELFDLAFFESITYTLPDNTVKKFNPKSPVFMFSGSFENVCLELLQLVRAREFGEANVYVEKSIKRGVFSRETGDILLKTLTAIAKAAHESDNATVTENSQENDV